MAQIVNQILLFCFLLCIGGMVPNILLPTHSPVLSSVFEDPENFEAMNGIDGNVHTAAHTDLESVNWFQAELYGFYSVSMVTVINRLYRDTQHR